MFGTPAEFHEAYPTIEDITVEVKEAGYMVKHKASGTYTKENIRPDFDCNNVRCNNYGGINIEPTIREMVRNKQTELEKALPCKGNEGSPQGQHVTRSCMNHFEIKISIKYKEEAAS